MPTVKLFLAYATRRLPLAGVLAFALASTWALYNYFLRASVDPSPVYLIPATLTEVLTAWLVYQAVESGHTVTRSNLSKQDRRFGWIVLALALLLAVPTLAVSAVANVAEFGGDVLLGLLFPVACVACAVGGALPRVVGERKAQGARERDAELTQARAALRDARAELAEARREAEAVRATGRELRAATDEDVVAAREECADGNGSRVSPHRVNVALARMGCEPMAESTLRGRL